jgi:lipoprotein-releasing system permease protein
MAYPTFIGSRYLRSRKKKSISAIGMIAIAGIALGVASLLVVISISSGFQDEFIKKVLGVNSHVLVMKYGIDFTEYREVMAKAEELPEARGVAPFVFQQMMISKGEKTGGVLIKGVDPERLDDVLDLPNYIVDGTLKGLRIPGAKPPDASSMASSREESDRSENSGSDESKAREEAPGIVLGKTLAENLEAGVGDIVQVTTPLIGLDVLGWSPSEGTPRTRAFRVIGIFYAGFLEYDTKLAYVDYYEAQRFFDQGDSVTGVEVTLRNIQAARVVGQRLKQMLGAGPYRIIDWEMLNEPLFTALKMQKVVLTVVLAVIVGLAAFNIIATLVMMVFDKRREIAILKSMGATHGGIARVFLHVGTVIGVVGIAIGLAIGLGVCLLLREVGWPLDPKVYLIDHLPVRLELMDFAISAVVAFIICLLAAILPSLSASRLRPVDGIRQD